MFRGAFLKVSSLYAPLMPLEGFFVVLDLFLMLWDYGDERSDR